jgi:DNA-binding MarR family transcriptional regulator
MSQKTTPDRQTAEQETSSEPAITRSYSGMQQLSYNGSYDRFLRLTENIQRVNTYTDSVKTMLGKKFGISRPQVTILFLLSKRDYRDGLSIQEIADHLLVTGTFITNETKKLEQQNILTRKPDPQDRRRIRLTFTPKGQKLCSQLADVLTKATSARWNNISNEQFLVLCDVYEELAQSSERYRHAVEGLLLNIDTDSFELS